MKNTYTVDGNTVSIILDSKKHGSRVTTISLDKLNKAKSFSGKWYIYSSAKSNSLYVKGNIIKEDGSRTTIFLHKFILDSPPEETIDHFDGNGLNNTNGNLRKCDNKLNSQNHTRIHKKNVTGFRGVSVDKRSGKFIASVYSDYKKIHLGMFEDVNAANKVANIARALLMSFATDIDEKLEYFKEFNDNHCRLIFRYGAMASGKTEVLLVSNVVYTKMGKNTLLVSSNKNLRDGNNMIKSRNGMESQSISFGDDDNIYDYIVKENEIKPIDMILVDEVHFLNKDQIFQLARIVDRLKINVICYGLKTDFKSNLFESVETLIAIADDLQLIIGYCDCGGLSNMNMRLSDGKPIFNGKIIEVGAEERYKAVCRKCYINQREEVGH